MYIYFFDFGVMCKMSKFIENTPCGQFMPLKKRVFYFHDF